MSTKGRVEANAASTNNYDFEVDDLPSFFAKRVGELERQIGAMQLGDDTQQSTGRVPPGETELDIYVHHAADIRALWDWHKACEGGVAGYKRGATLHHKSPSGVVASFEIEGLWCKGFKIPELAQGEEGQAVMATATLAWDDFSLL